mgnify:FL=1
MKRPDIKRIFVSGPYTSGDVAVNVKNAIDAASKLMDAGYAVYLPHLSHFWHLVSPRPYQDWLKLDLEWLKLCDAIVRLDGQSPGADGEVNFAKENGKPVYTLKELL